MNVRLIAITKPVIPECDTANELVAYAARVSNPKNQANKKTALNLLKYCAKNSHWSIFEMANAVMEITTTRDITHQIIRHRSFSFQEWSQRYSDEIEFVTNKEARLQDAKNRQNSIKQQNTKLQLDWEETQRSVAHLAQQAYNWAIKNGIAKECARVVLPEGLTLTTIYVNGTIRSWLHYLKVRLDPSTQLEHREVAQECYNKLQEYFPNFEELMI